jgi:NTP pyrophosphatase (non-canonical NTP hydrolase)
MFSIGSKRWPGISKLIEECGEVVQVCGKLIASRGESAHWDGSDLRVRLHEELGDLMGAIWFVIAFCGLDEMQILKRAQRKRAQFEVWQESNPEVDHGV